MTTRSGRCPRVDEGFLKADRVSKTMKSKDWKDIAELVGIAAIVASLIFVGLQMRQDQKIAQAQAYVDGAATYIEMSRLILDHQDIWMRGLDDAELSVIEGAKFEQIARTWHLRRVNQWNLNNRLGTGNRERLMNRAAYEIYIHPGLRRWFHDYVGLDQVKRLYEQDEWSSTFSNRLEQVLAEMDRDSVPIPSKKTYLVN